MDKRYQVFVSSTYDDLKEERKEATKAILECKCFPEGMEFFPASNETQWDMIKKAIDESDFYLLIIGGRYGSIGINSEGKKISYTEMEFDYAKSKGIPIISMIHNNPKEILSGKTENTLKNQNKLEKFKAKAMNTRVVGWWNNKSELKGEIIRSLHHAIELCRESAVGWIRANSITPDKMNTPDGDNFPKDNITLVKDKIRDNDPAGVIRFLELIKNDTLMSECLKDMEFIERFALLISISQPKNVILSAINLLFPCSLTTGSRIQLRSLIDIQSLFNTYCTQTNTKNELHFAFLKLLLALDVDEKEYFDFALDIYKTGNLSSSQKYICLKYLKHANLNHVKTDLITYISNEFYNENRTLSVDDLIALLSIVYRYNGDKIFTAVYDIFKKSNIQVQKEMIYGVIEYCGSDYVISTPKIQRMFIELCDIVHSWKDERTDTDLLLYCLFCRTYDVFSTEEIYDSLKKFNNDVFYMFISDLSTGEYSTRAESYYYILDEEIEIIKDVIKARKHPREKKLLEKFEDHRWYL